jgi:hypothetical protein
MDIVSKLRSQGRTGVGGEVLRIELRIEPELEEAYAILYAPEMTGELQELAALLARKSLRTGVLAARRGDRIYFISTQQVEIIRAEGGSICMYDSAGKKYELEGMYA